MRDPDKELAALAADGIVLDVATEQAYREVVAEQNTSEPGLAPKPGRIMSDAEMKGSALTPVGYDPDSDDPRVAAMRTDKRRPGRPRKHP